MNGHDILNLQMIGVICLRWMGVIYLRYIDKNRLTWVMEYKIELNESSRQRWKRAFKIKHGNLDVIQSQKGRHWRQVNQEWHGEHKDNMYGRSPGWYRVVEFWKWGWPHSFPLPFSGLVRSPNSHLYSGGTWGGQKLRAFRESSLKRWRA